MELKKALWPIVESFRLRGLGSGLQFQLCPGSLEKKEGGVDAWVHVWIDGWMHAHMDAHVGR